LLPRFTLRVMLSFHPLPCILLILCTLLPGHPTLTLFPYTTLFRSDRTRAYNKVNHSYLNKNFITYVRSPQCRNMLKSFNILRHRSEEHTSELQSRFDLVCRLLLEKKKRTR